MLFEIKPREPRMQFICDLKPPTMLDHIKSIIKYFKTDRNNKYPGRWINDWYMVLCTIKELLGYPFHILKSLFPFMRFKKQINPNKMDLFLFKTKLMIKLGYNPNSNRDQSSNNRN